jgi:hypothetical protein
MMINLGYYMYMYTISSMKSIKLRLKFQGWVLQRLKQRIIRYSNNYDIIILPSHI